MNKNLTEYLKTVLMEIELVCSRLISDITRMELSKLDKSYYKANIGSNFNRLGYLLYELNSKQGLVRNTLYEVE